MTPQEARVWLQTALSDLDRAEKHPTADDEFIYRCVLCENNDPEDLRVLDERQIREPEFLALCIRRIHLEEVLRGLAYWLTNERWPDSPVLDLAHGLKLSDAAAERVFDDLKRFRDIARG